MQPAGGRLDAIGLEGLVVSTRIRGLVSDLREECAALDRRIKAYDEEFAAVAREDTQARRLSGIPGVGVINATALLAAVGDGSAFARGRDLACWLGLTPRQHSTGGKTNGAINGRRFRAYVEHCLASELAPGDIVVADNLASHKVAGVRAAIEARGASLLFLPAYSPGLNPIEQVFAKLEHLVRSFTPRSRETLCTAIGRSLERFAPAECSNYLTDTGYTQSA
jgi:transposase